jgi:hypothetical protein
MMRKFVKIIQMILVALLTSAICHASPAGVKTEKAAYTYGEPIKVTFSGAPGLDSDWVCIVPAGSPDTDGGDFKYMPKGSRSGTLTFDPPAPGNYEVRAYYNYRKVGYAVASRATFSVTGDAANANAMERLRERKLDTADPFEANVPDGKALVYIFRESWYGSAAVDVEILCNNKPVVVLGHSDYYPFVVQAGELRFNAGDFFQAGTTSRTEGMNRGEAPVDVKAGHVYYLRAKVVAFAHYENFVEIMPHREGAEMIKGYGLKLRK